MRRRLPSDNFKFSKFPPKKDQVDEDGPNQLQSPSMTSKMPPMTKVCFSSSGGVPSKMQEVPTLTGTSVTGLGSNMDRPKPMMGDECRSSRRARSTEEGWRRIMTVGGEPRECGQ